MDLYPFELESFSRNLISNVLAQFVLGTTVSGRSICASQLYKPSIILSVKRSKKFVFIPVFAHLYHHNAINAQAKFEKYFNFN